MPKASQIMPKHSKEQKPFAGHKPKPITGPAARAMKATHTPAENGSIKK